ncbi:MAG: hypothetical protein ORN21_05745, partial [Methylophilaceae bacterium]|nr:hypothetical protein [Methylophilaceae bacterium]
FSNDMTSLKSGQANATLSATGSSVSWQNGAQGYVYSLDNLASPATVTVAAGSTISNVKVAISGLLDGANELLVVGASRIVANGSAATSGTVTVGGDSWSWTYSNFSFSFALSGATATQAQNLIRALAYIDNATTPTAGNRTFAISAQDSSGNLSAPALAIIDTLMPTAPSLVLVSDTGRSASDGVTNNPTVTVTGLESGATWVYAVDSTTSGWITGTDSSFIATSGAHSYFVQQTDLAGNTSSVGTRNYNVINTVATPVLSLVSDTGASASDGLTYAAGVIVNGLSSLATWQYQVDGGSWISASGSIFNATIGAHTYLARQIDAAGNTSTVSNSAIYTLDTVSPGVPVVRLASDTGISASDGITNNPTIVVSGLQDVGATWQYQLADVDGTVWRTGVGSSFSAISGLHNYLVRQIDTAGNVATTAVIAAYNYDNNISPIDVDRNVAGVQSSKIQ